MPKKIHLSDKSIRIAVVGGFSSGKTKFIESICETGKNDDEARVYYDESKEFLFKNANKWMPGLDIGKIVEDEWTLYLFGNPGACRFDISWFTEEPFLVENIAGFVVMIDSGKYLPGSLCEAVKVYYQVSAQKLPYVIAANYQDMPDALSPETIKSIFRTEPEVKVLPCIASKKESAVSVLHELLLVLPNTPEKDLFMRKIQKI